MEYSKLLRINWQDFVNAATNTIVVAVGGVLWGYASGGDFNWFTADWGLIFSQALNVGISSFVSFLGAYFFANKEGKIGGLKVK